MKFLENFHKLSMEFPQNIQLGISVDDDPRRLRFRADFRTNFRANFRMGPR